MYSITLFLVKFISLLPFGVLYVLSDFFYFIVHYVLGYRKKVVRENLKNSFPEKTFQERKNIEKKFYRHFCDLIFEGLKLYSMSPDELGKRMQFVGHQAVLSHYDEGRSVMLLASHYGNWEWTSFFSTYLPSDKPVYQVYRKQKSSISDRIIDKLRRRFGARNIEMKSLYRSLIQMKQAGKLGMFGMISDQSPRWHDNLYWTDFLNQPTAMIDGTEQIAQKFNYPVYYCGVRKIKRGYYTCTFLPICTEPKEAPEHEITEKYVRLLEKTIQEHPAYWLWSHKRWKHNKRLEVGSLTGT
jgi:KDO2-lipid IV(A) lauroyltransferase